MTANPEKPAAGFSENALLLILEEILADLAREREPGKRPTKDDLLAVLKSGSRKLQLFFLRHLSPRELSALRRDPEFAGRLTSELRRLIIGLHQPLLDPERVKRLRAEASLYPLAEVRRDPDLWAARLVAEFPGSLEIALPLVDLRYLLAFVQSLLEARIPRATCLEELDRAYRYIERELGGVPRIELFVKRAFALAGNSADPGEVTAYYSLLSRRIPDTLARLPLSQEKDKTLLVLKDLTGLQDSQALRLYFKKKAMEKADELMKSAGSYEELYELRFFFSQIGERSNRKLLSKKTGELARSFNIRTEGYRLLDQLIVTELDEDGLLELVPAVLCKAEIFVLGAPRRYLDRLLDFYLETACPLLRRLKNAPEKVPRLIQNFKRQVGLLNLYRDLDHLAQVLQRKMVLAVCGPEMLKNAPEKILSFLTRLPPEFYPPGVMQVLRSMVRGKGAGYRFSAGDVLRLLTAYPEPEEEAEPDREAGKRA